MEQRLGMLAEPYEKGLAGRLTRLSRALSVTGLGLSALSRRRPWVRRVAGASYSAGSLALRFAVFEAGRESARDPKYVVVPQRERIRAREEEARRQGSGTVSV